MSWQAYIDTSLVGTGNVDSAAIFSINGKDNWARSPNFKISPEEMKAILDTYKDPSGAYSNGLKVDGQKYTLIQVIEDSLRTKKGKEGFIVVKTAQALLLAHHPETVTTNSCVATVEQLGDYLRGVGY